MSALSRKLTLTAVQNIETGAIRWDSQVKGFGAQGNKNGTTTFVVKTRVLGKQRWVTIGKLGSPWTVETARKEALRILSEAAAGRDAVESKRLMEAEARLFATVAEDFMAQHSKKLKPASVISYRALLRDYLVPALGRQRVSDITRADVAKLHTQMAEKPRTANIAIAVLSKLMSWAEQQGLRPDGTNPVRRVERYRETRRERFLSPEEFARLGRALDEAERSGEHGVFVIAAIRLLILTGARLSEILTLKWSYVDTHRRALVLPDSKTGAKAIPLNQQALNILAALPRLDSNAYVLPGQRHGQNLINLQKPWREIRHKAGLDDVRLHDLRHSFASMGVAAGGSLPVIGRLLGHSQAQTTARYAHVADKLALDLAEATGAQIAEAMQGKAS